MKDTMITARNLVLSSNSKDEYLAITGSLLVVAQEMYVTFMGSKETAKMFYTIADSLATRQD